MNPIPHNPVGWFEIYVRDMARARKFYEAVFQVSLTRLPTTMLEMWAFPKADGAMGCSGALAKMDGKDSGGSGTIIYFVSGDCSVEAARVPEAGGSILRPKFSIGEHGFIALVKDSEGNVIGLYSRQ